MYWIKQLDPIESLMSRELFKEVDKLLTYTAVYYQNTMYRKVRKEYQKTTKIGVRKDGVLFYTGLIPKILKFCVSQKISVDFTPHEPVIQEINSEIPLELRSFQDDMLSKSHIAERGILKAPTGTGKTVLGLALIYSIKDLGSVLWLCHTKDLMYQTANEAKKFFGSIGMMGDGNCVTDKFLTVATRQTFKDYADDLGTAYDMVIVDEVHHVNTFDSEYGTILKKIYAPIRIGLTATLPTSQEALLAMEALIGPVISELTINQGKEQGFMAKPIIKIVKIPESFRVKEIRKYTDVYEHGVVRRLERNRIIVGLIKKHVELGDSILVVINKIAHGELILNMCHASNIHAELINGASDTDSRTLAKQALNDKSLQCVIASTVWKEGVNIPELNVVINAAGGKSEIVTLQSIGRGLRKTDTKSELIIYDFFDNSHHHIISHFGERFSLYCDMGWI